MTRLLAGLTLCLLLISPAAAQTDSGPSATEAPAPAHLAVIDGVAWLDRQGKSEPAPLNMPLVAGDRVRTDDGRVEVLFGDGSALYLDHYTTVDFQSDALLRLLTGRLRLVVVGLDPNNPDERVNYRIDTPSAAVDVVTVGDYRVSLIGVPVANDTELAVLRGTANLVADGPPVVVGAGARSVARAGAAPSVPAAFNSARWDAFDRWSEAQQSARLGVASNAYLPSSLSTYASTFDQYGQWRQDPTYGSVWYPTVGPNWEPYWYGNWNYVGPYGWTWIGADPWAWPTHHYGRWGFSAGLWFWIPGAFWGPAWVSWAWGPSYVGWCPLGYNGWPVFGLHAGYWPHSYYGYGGHHGGHGWHVAHADEFAHGRVSPRTHGVPLDRLDDRTRNAFVAHADAPAPRGLAMARPAPPIRVAGDRSHYAVPRTLGGASDSMRSIAPGGPTGGRAAPREPAASLRGLGAPQRYGPTSDSPGLGAVASPGRARATVQSDRASAPAALGSPRRVPNAGSAGAPAPSFDRATPRRAPLTTWPAPDYGSAPSYAPRGGAMPRQYQSPSQPGPRYDAPAPPVRQPGMMRENAPVYRRGGEAPSAGRPDSPSRGRPSGLGQGGAPQRGAAPRSPGGSSGGEGSRSGSGGGSRGSAVRRPPG